MAKHPIQPIETDDHGTARFKQNAIVRFLLDEGPFDLNKLGIKSFPNEDREQFAQLIGYSVSGFGELSYVSNDTYGTADKMCETDVDERDARIAYLEEQTPTMDRMTAPEFCDAIANLGYSHHAFARYVGADERTVRRWAKGQQDIPLWVPVMLELMLRGISE